MAGAADYLRLAQQGYGIERPDVGKVFSDAAKGYTMAKDIDERQTLADVGLAASQGDMAGAQKTAFERGNVEMGIKLDTHQRGKVVDALKQLQMVGSTAESQTDDQWAQSVQMFRKQGLNVPPQFEGPQGRLLAVAQSKSTAEKLKEELTKAQTGQANASAAASNAQASLAPAHADLYKAQAEQARAHATAFTAQAENAGEAKIPQGYRKAEGGDLEAIPGGPADTKINEKRQADYASLQYLTQSLDNLAKSANAVLTHSGLDSNFGLYGMVPNRPGSNAADADAMLRTLKTQGAFATLQDMRNASKTGGALGAVSDKETAMLQHAIASLEKSQSVEQVKENLKNLIDFVEQSKARVRGAYDDHWKNNGAAARQAATPAPRLPPAAHGQAIDEARQAIARGAPKEAVIQRLRQLGVDTGGL